MSPRTTTGATAGLIALATLVGGCEPGTREAELAGPPPATIIETPAAPGSGEPNLTTGPDGIYLSWIEPVGTERHAVRFARWDGAGWSEVQTIVERAGLFVNWADFPSLLALDDGTLAAHWLERSGPAPYAYDVRMALSRDGGASWSDDLVPHRDGTQTEHGFVSLVPVDGHVGVVWLDGREMVEGGPMALRFTTLSADGTLAEEVVLDGQVCECCQTGVAHAAAGPAVVYRGRADGEVRDIRITRRVDGRWTEGQTVHDDGWVIPGCPVNGPAIVAEGDQVAVAWFTGAEPRNGGAGTRQDVRRMSERGRVLVAFSDDGGASFSAPARVDDGGGMGRVHLVGLDGSTVLAVWMERTQDGAEVRARRVSPRGAGPSAAITPTTAERASGFPRVARRGDELLFAWTQTGSPGLVRTARARVDGAEQ